MAECVGSLYAKNVSTQESMFPLANVLMAEYLSPKAAQSRPIVDAQCISLIIVKSHTSSQDSGKLPVPFLPAVWQSSGQTLSEAVHVSPQDRQVSDSSFTKGLESRRQQNWETPLTSHEQAGKCMSCGKGRRRSLSHETSKKPMPSCHHKNHQFP